MSDALPDKNRPLTATEVLERACDWSDYRKAYGESPDPDRNRQDHALFCAGWDAALRYADRRDRKPSNRGEDSRG